MARLHGQCFPDRAWSAQEFEDFMQVPGKMWQANADQTAMVWVQKVPPEAEILTLAVAPNQRRKGEAKALLSKLISTLPSVDVEVLFLEVASDNMAAMALYSGLGFDVTGRRKDYYGAGRDAVLMSLAVPSPPSA